MHKNNESQRVRYISDRIGDVTNLLTQAQWLTGSPDTALRNSKAAVEYALATQHHVAIVNALSYVCPIYYWTGNYEECGRYAEMFDDLALRHGFTIRRPVAMFYRAALAGAYGNNPAQAVDGIEKAIVEFNSTGHLARMPYYLAVLAENYLGLGQLDSAKATIQKSRKIAQEKNDRWCVPEVLRINASILVSEGQMCEAEALLIESMNFAQDIGALSWRLRSANDLTRLLVGDSRADDARRMLTAVLNEFSEGYATRDLVATTALLKSLK
jgi:tetratricopeptide (TPR) repeat protein